MHGADWRCLDAKFPGQSNSFFLPLPLGEGWGGWGEDSCPNCHSLTMRNHPHLNPLPEGEEDRTKDGLEELRTRLAAFAAEREWDQFHSPKNLSMALIAECAELIEHFQWMSEAQSKNLSPEKLEAVSHELADILIFLIRVADKLGVNLIEAANVKIGINEQRYPAERVRGSARRAEEYED